MPRVEPLFFGEPALFGAYHPPQGEAARPLGVLLCPPLGHEHTRAYRALKGLAESLARAGHHVLRFDYSGLGDSAGEFEDASVDRWCEDVACALDELGALSGARDLRLVGLRFGAALAVHSQARPATRRRVGGLVLWDPVLSGEEFLDTADRLHAAFVRDASRFPRLAHEPGGPATEPGDDRLGYAYGERLRRDMRRVDLRDPLAWPALPVRFVLSEPHPGVELLLGALQQRVPSAASVHVPGMDGEWSSYARHELTLRAGRVVKAVVDDVCGGRS